MKTNTIKKGLWAGGIVAVLSVAVILIAWGTIQQRNDKASYVGDGNIFDWIVRWALIGLVTGLVLSVLFPYVSARIRWTKQGYVAFSVLSMVILDLLAYLPIYDSAVQVYPEAYLGLNAVFCIGFGTLIPTSNNPRHHGRLVL